MNDNTKIELSREIMNAMIARSCINGFSKDNPATKKLLEEEREMNNFNFKVIDKIINVYGPMIKRGEV